MRTAIFLAKPGSRFVTFLRFGSVFFVASCIAIGLPTTATSDEKKVPLPIEELKRATPVDFEKEILPLLKSNCIACHNATDAESDLNVETPQAIRKGGSEGPAVVPGNSAKSRLLMAAAHQIEETMPPEDNDVGANNLTPKQLGLLKLWIDQGAKGEVTGSTKPLSWQPLPPGVNPIYSAAITPDGQYAVAARANQIFVYHVPSRRVLGRLTDPALLKTETYSKPGVAHLDLVQSLAFNPQGDLLASGGYRNVKLWRKEFGQKKADIAGLTSAARSGAVSPDGNILAIGETSGPVQLISLPSLKLLRTLKGHTAAVTGLGFTKDSKTVVSASEDNSVRTWQVADGKPAGVMDVGQPVSALAIIADSTQIATAHTDKSIKIWAFPKLANADKKAMPVKTLTGHSGPVTSLASIGAAAQLLSGSVDGTMRLWDVASGKQLRSFNHGGPITSVAARADGLRIVSASENAVAKLFDPKTGKQIAELSGHIHRQLEVARLARDVTTLQRRVGIWKGDVTAAENRSKAETAAVKKATDAKVAADKSLAEKTAAAKKTGEAKAVTVRALADANTTKTTAEAQVATAEKIAAAANAALAKAKAAKPPVPADVQNATKSDAEAKKALAAAKKALAAAVNKIKQAQQQVNKTNGPDAKARAEVIKANTNVAGALRSIEASKAGAKRAADAIPKVKKALAEVEAQLKSAQTQQATGKTKSDATRKPLRSVAFSSDGKTVATAGDFGSIHTWDSETGTAIEVFSAGDKPITTLVFTSPGEVMAGGTDNSSAVWNTDVRWVLRRTIGNVNDPKTLIDRVIGLDFSHDGKLLATGSGEPSRSGELKIWNVADGKLVRKLEKTHSDTIFGVAFSPDGKHIASSAADRFVKVFSLADGKLARAFEGHTHHVLGVSWGGDGRQLASCGADNVIKVWDFRTGDQRRTIAGFSKEVTSIHFVGPSNINAIACSGDKNVKIIRTDNGGNVRSFAGAADFVYATAVSDDGSVVVAGGHAGVLHVWNGTNGKLIIKFEPPPIENKQAAK